MAQAIGTTMTVTASKGKRDSSYLTARIARDRPDVLEEMKEGQYSSDTLGLCLDCRPRHEKRERACLTPLHEQGNVSATVPRLIEQERAHIQKQTKK
jgi:hypothetical protein